MNCENDKERLVHYRFYSKSISQESLFLVYTPGNEEKPSPVLYLLNGFGADVYAWPSGADLASCAVEYAMYIVSITAGSNYYANSLKDTTKKYDDYVLEIINIVDENFNTLSTKSNRGIGGISNGGGGALYLGAKHSERFNTVSSLSAGVYEFIFPVAENLKNVKVMFDCGREDFLLNENRYLHDFLNTLKISHRYNEYPGRHDWRYWGEHYRKHMEFHAGNFER